MHVGKWVAIDAEDRSIVSFVEEDIDRDRLVKADSIVKYLSKTDGGLASGIPCVVTTSTANEELLTPPGSNLNLHCLPPIG